MRTLGKQEVRMEITYEQLMKMKEITKPQVREMVRCSFDLETALQSRQHAQWQAEATHWRQGVMEGRYMSFLSLVAEFLGENPRTDGGTMGEPYDPPEWMYIICRTMIVTEAKVFRFHWREAPCVFVYEYFREWYHVEVLWKWVQHAN